MFRTGGDREHVPVASSERLNIDGGIEARGTGALEGGFGVVF